jgi:multiple sugar transport system permease protein
MTSTPSTIHTQAPVRSGRFHISSDLRLALLFILPAVVLVAILMYYPMIGAVRESLYKTPKTSWLDPNPPQIYVGLEHYQKLTSDVVFKQILKNSLYWTIGVVFFQNVIGLATALLLDQKLPARALMRALVLLPWVLPGVVNAILWRFMYDPQLGLINSILIGTGITHTKIAWLAQTGTALPALIVAATVMFLAALQGVDHEQVEAAQIDGANAWQRFRYVVIPAISGIIRLNLLLTTIWTFNYFDLIWVTTAGGPLKHTHIFPTIIYQTAFRESGNFGKAAAYGVLAVLVLSVFAVLYLRELRRSEVL